MLPFALYQAAFNLYVHCMLQKLLYPILIFKEHENMQLVNMLSI